MSFIKKISCLVISLAIFSITSVTFAQNANPVSRLEPVDCFAPGLYKFQSVQVSVGPEKGIYAPGETINFVGEIVNQNDYPVVDGNVFVRISQDNPNYMSDGHNAVAEITALSNVAVDASSSLPVKFTWTVPKDLGAGDYRADYFFSVGNKFNLGGLPFTNEIIVGFANFKITSTKNTEFVLDRAGTEVNGVKYNHIGNWPTIDKGEKIQITQPIKNLSNKEITVSVNYDLYFWDSLNVADKLDSKAETVTVPANSSKVLSYTIPKSEQSVYYLRIKATVGGASSIVNIRTTSDIEKARINYPAITAFPLVKGDIANLFSCFHTVYGTATNSKMALTLTDKDGQSVVTGVYTGTFGSQMNAASLKFTADKDYTFLNLKAELQNEQGQVVDSYQTAYDCSTLKSAKCDALMNNEANSSVLLLSLILILITLIGIFIIHKFIKESIFKKIFLVIFVLLLILSLAVLVIVLINGTNRAGAETVSVDGKTKTQANSISYSLGRYFGPGDYRTIIYGVVQGVTSVVLSGNTTLNVNDTASFSVTQECSFTGNGGAYDTPYCGDTVASVLNDRQDTYRQRLLWGSLSKPTRSAVSSNTAVMTCSGLSCRAVGGGTAVITVKVPQASTAAKLAYRTGLVLRSSVDRYDPVLDPITVCSGCQDKYFSDTSIELSPGTGDRTIEIPAYSPTWTFMVTVPIINGSCGTNGQTYAYASSSYSGTFCATGTSSPLIPTFPNAGSSTSWSCVGSGTGHTDASCIATRSLPPTALSVSCTVNPTTANIGDTVTWTATPTGGTGSYTYSWVGNGFVNGATTRIVSGDYGTTGPKYASTTVTSGTTVAVGCPGTIVEGGTPTCPSCGGGPGGRGPGGGIVITDNGVCNPAYKDQFVFGKPGTDRCSHGTSTEVTGDGTITPWVWSCIPFNSSYLSDIDCRAALRYTPSPSLNCSLSTLPIAPVNVNNNTTWTASLATPCPSCLKTWTISDANGTVTTNSYNGTLDKIFTTVGIKTVSLVISSTTAALQGNSCSATTSIVQSGGSTREI